MSVTFTPGLATTKSDAVDNANNRVVMFIPGKTGIADTKAPKLSEVVAGVDLTFYFKSEGFAPSRSQDTGKDTRYTSNSTFGSQGAVTDTGKATYVINPASPENDVARLLLTAGGSSTFGFFVERIGVPHDQEFAAGDLVNVYPVNLGAPQPVTAATDEKAQLESDWVSWGETRDMVAIAADS